MTYRDWQHLWHDLKVVNGVCECGYRYACAKEDDS